MFVDSTDSTQVDEGTPERLLRQGGERLLRRVSCAYVDHWDERVAELFAAIEGGPVEEARRLAHGLRSSSDLVGLTGLARRFARLEAHAGTEGASGPRAAAEAQREVESAYEQVRPWIERRTGR